MHGDSRWSFVAVLVVLVGVLAVSQAAVGPSRQATEQAPWSWPEKTENLTELPAHWTGARLRPVMTGFSRALGVGCAHCHVGEEDEPLGSYDFVSDANPNKDRAREMLRMLGSINDHLDKLEPSGPERVNMWCHTCHRGRPRPMTLTEELGECYGVRGADAAVALLAELKERWYGRGVYDFRDENPLNDLGYRVLEQDAAGAVTILQANVEAYPTSANAWDSLGEACLAAGDKDRARESYQKALELDPGMASAREALDRLKR